MERRFFKEKKNEQKGRCVCIGVYIKWIITCNACVYSTYYAS